VTQRTIPVVIKVYGYKPFMGGIAPIIEMPLSGVIGSHSEN